MNTQLTPVDKLLAASQNTLQSVQSLSKEVISLKEEVGVFGGRIERIEQNMTIDSRLHQNIIAHAKKHVMKLVNGNVNPEYGKAYKNVIQKLWRDYRQFFGITSYKDTKMIDYDRAIEWINAWRPFNWEEER